MNTGAAAAADELRALAATLAPGARLPSTRNLQQKFSISALTAQRVLGELARAGLVEVRPGKGSYVAARRMTEAVDLSWQTSVIGNRDDLDAFANTKLLPSLPEGTHDLQLGYLADSLQPRQLLATAAARAARRPYVWDRAAVEGLPELRAHLAASSGQHYGPENVLISSGGQAALSLIFRALARPGDTVLFEHLTYPGAVAAARAAGLVAVPVRADASGIVPDALEETLIWTAARLLYLQPRHSNPTGSVLAPDRREAVLRSLRDHDVFCVEDDYVQPLDLSGPSPESLASRDETGHVIHLQSLTKPVAPGLRIAAITSAGAATARLRRYRLVDDLFVAPVMQQTALELLTAPGWSRHLAMLRRELAARRDALVGGLREHSAHAGTITPPHGGLNVWWPLPAHLDEDKVVAAALEVGVAVGAGSGWVLGDPPGPALRLTYGRTSVASLGSAARILADIVDSSGRP